MMAKENATWFKLYRGWQDNPMFRSDKDKLNWLWLIEHAVINEVTISINNKPVRIHRGQLCYSLSYLSKAWGCSLSYVRTYLKHLKLWQAIDTQNDKGQTLITICNYCRFQDAHTQNDKGAVEKVTRRSHRSDNNTKNDKELKNKEYIIGDATPPKTPNKKDDKFEEFWKECPRKIGKGKAREKYLMAVKNEPHEFLVEMMKIHAKDMKGKEEQFIPHPATWLHQERYHDETKASIIVQEKKEWPKWKTKIAALLGDHVVNGWFNTAELRGDVLSFSKRFEFNHVKERHTVDLSKIGINEIIYKP
jgi:hypothetical protein